jgi:hypothetical protein
MNKHAFKWLNEREIRLCYQVWQYMPIIPAPRKLRQEDHGLETSLGYKARPCLKKTNIHSQNQQQQQRTPHRAGRWLTPIILATQEAEIRRIKVRSQPQAINSVRSYLENT